ncbi:DUF349 domain-containing protein [Epilithonimonas arachidiradicis]|uniref:Uncharacterized protein DUF349 n=1 Tax=Epilithonimonas arachidiradicis TaxID=1617282 RepID=A0A420DA69_9FLAO|nr:DUF349 domain-containing protein [Epilithonimonas arachidiradicis]RKE88178.1 uncharacterized protein DUF349 [Epilithonimonas arachidiradicis]GGG50746.1 hypothetical protein GCM10007332_10530 [Epilithonimonas arachidiradicis]
MSIENENPENENLNPETNAAENQPVEETVASQNSETETESEHQETEVVEEDFSHYSLKEALDEMEKIVNKDDASSFSRRFNTLREQANHKLSDEIEDKKHEYLEQGNPEEHFEYHHPQASKLSALVNIFKEKQDKFHKQQEAEHQGNLQERLAIIERLKNLYTNSEPGTNLFKSIREIKEAWGNAGQVAKSEFKNLNNNYFHHLKMFNEMLDLNKEYLEQEFAHNLEKRQHIIQRAKELLDEKVVQKALNELQYLHKLWKEEAEPVAEEFREKTWEEFKEISNKIHERKSELIAVIETEQLENLEKKNKIIEELKTLSAPQNINHTYWQQAIKRVEEIRSEFLKLGAVPKKLSNQNWTDFKQSLRDFNTAKNDFYKNLKGSQIQNLEEKQALIKTAQDNMNSEDWDTVVPLFKKLQEDWKKIGHVPRSQANKVWDDFRDACNTFFKNYRDKNNATGDNWKENYKNKKALLEELKALSDEEGAVEKIETIKNSWNAIGKVPKDKLSINTEFNKTLREKLKLNKINEFDLKEENLTENQLTDKARKIKNQITDLESEVVQLENNLAFFNSPTRENPLLKDTYDKLDSKKEQLESLKVTLHNIIAGE